MKIILTVILSLLAVIASGLDIKDFVEDLRTPYKLNYGVAYQPTTKINDFSTPVAEYAKTSGLDAVTYSVSNESISRFSDWYHLDFSTEPFDGRIEPLVLGEPLPSPGLTLALALGTAGIILYSRKRKLT